jgi:hypothetical protein
MLTFSIFELMGIQNWRIEIPNYWPSADSKTSIITHASLLFNIKQYDTQNICLVLVVRRKTE